MKRAGIIMLYCLGAASVFARPEIRDINSKYISFQEERGAFQIVSGKTAATVCVSKNDDAVCGIAAEDLCDDVERVSGIRPALTDQPTGKNVIVIGTIEKNPTIKTLVRAGKLDISAIQGKWENCIIAVLDQPMAGVDKMLVVAGSDRRGAAFGVYDLSRKIGVSPWYWWADVPVEQHDNLFVKAGHYLQRTPSVKYRGIFINDEDWGMHPWAKETFSPEDGGIGPKVYAKVFELLLRLKANHIWPAMHGVTKGFYRYPENPVLADQYAIVMGTSHCEQMHRNNVSEWHDWLDTTGTDSVWDWNLGKTEITEYWRQRTEAVGEYENVFTLGMRNVHDSGMPCKGATKEEKAQIMAEEIFPRQRDMIRKYIDPDPTKVPQMFCPYKEVLELYNMGMKVPDDVTIIWPDDNIGYLRNLPSPAERKRSGGHGVYYHFSFTSWNTVYLWTCTTAPALIWEEMFKSYEYGADKIWIANVGDIKPAELCTDFFLQMAWDIDRWDQGNIRDFLREWSAEQFGGDRAGEIADVLAGYYRLTQSRKPEFMPNQEGYHRAQFAKGEEAMTHLAELVELDERASKIYDALPERYRDAYYETVLYAIRANRFMNEKILYQERNRFLVDLGSASANKYAQLSMAAQRNIEAETASYNRVADGKWNHMMSFVQNEQFHSYYMHDNAPLTLHADPHLSRMAVLVEDETEQASHRKNNVLPPVHALAPEKRFIYLFNQGGLPYDWTATVSHPWVQLSATSGTVTDGQKLWLDFDWDQVPTGSHEVTVTITGPKKQKIKMPIKLTVTKPAALPRNSIGDSIIHAGGKAGFEAEAFSRNLKGKACRWAEVDTLGFSGKSALTVLPMTVASKKDVAAVLAESPVLEYDIYFSEPGKQEVTVYCLPTQSINADHELRYAVSIDDQTPQLVEFNAEEKTKQWLHNVIQGFVITKTEHRVANAGKHTLKIRMVDPGVVVDKIEISTK